MIPFLLYGIVQFVILISTVFHPCPGCERNTLVRIAADSAPYNQVPTDSKYSSWQKAWRMLGADSSIMYQNQPGDTQLQNFYFSHNAGSLGRLHKVKKHILDENFLIAASENQSVNPNCLHEFYQKLVNVIYLETFASEIYTFTVLQDSVLNSIASQDPNEFGRAVYDARAMLGINYDDGGLNTNRYDINEDKDTPIDNVHIYPNPAFDFLNFYLSDTDPGKHVDLKVYSSIGALVLNKIMITGSINRVNLTGLSEGCYYYFLRAGPGKTLQGRIIILRK